MSLRWTGQASLAAAIGLTAGAVGAWLAEPLLVWGGTLCLVALALDGTLLAGGLPKATFQVHPTRIPESESARVTVQARGLRAAHQIQLPLAPALRLAKGTNLLTTNAMEFEVSTHARGPHAIGPLQMRSWSPLRLWVKQQDLAPSQTIEVIPRAADLSDIRLASRVVTPVQGRFQVNRPGQGFDFFTLREYHAGDTMRSINWKATARRDDLIVNQRQTETFSEIVILLDARNVTGLGEAGNTPLDVGCRLALGAFEDALAHRDEAHFAAYGEGLHLLQPVRQDRVPRLAELLARLPAAGATSIAAAWTEMRKDLKSSTGPIIAITSAEADDGLLDTVRSMVGQGHGVVVVSPRPADRSLGKQEGQRHATRQDVLSKLRGIGANVIDYEPQASPGATA